MGRTEWYSETHPRNTEGTKFLRKACGKRLQGASSSDTGSPVRLSPSLPSLRIFTHTRVASLAAIWSKQSQRRVQFFRKDNYKQSVTGIDNQCFSSVTDRWCRAALSSAPFTSLRSAPLRSATSVRPVSACPWAVCAACVWVIALLSLAAIALQSRRTGSASSTPTPSYSLSPVAHSLLGERRRESLHASNPSTTHTTPLPQKMPQIRTPPQIKPR